MSGKENDTGKAKQQDNTNLKEQVKLNTLCINKELVPTMGFLGENQSKIVNLLINVNKALLNTLPKSMISKSSEIQEIQKILGELVENYNKFSAQENESELQPTG